MLFKELFSDAIHLFYPHFCLGCGNDLIQSKEILCLRCMVTLPHTNFETLPGNPVEQIFWGRFDLEAAHSEFYFAKGQAVQELIHQLKYKGNKEAGIYLAKIMAGRLLTSGRFSGIDYLVPLPMFPAKEFKRGYNQATIICHGLAEVMQVPVLLNNVIRRYATETQTKKHRSERWENVAESFMVTDPEVLAGKHILLVDDVLTTGATMEACCQAMSHVPGIRISLATLAIASK
jgi:ComF family protein